MAASTAGLAPEDVQQFSSLRQQAALKYGLGSSNVTYQRGQVDQNNQFNTQALTHSYDLARQKLPGAYAHRGLLNSGIYDQGLQNYGYNRQQAFQKALMGYQQSQGGLDQQQNNINLTYQTDLAGVDAQQAARQAAIAAQLRMLG